MASPERSVFKLDLNELAVVVTTMATVGEGGWRRRRRHAPWRDARARHLGRSPTRLLPGVSPLPGASCTPAFRSSTSQRPLSTLRTRYAIRPAGSAAPVTTARLRTLRTPRARPKGGANAGWGQARLGCGVSTGVALLRGSHVSAAGIGSGPCSRILRTSVLHLCSCHTVY